MESLRTDSDMIYPSIESSDFLFWHEKSFELIFGKICELDKVRCVPKVRIHFSKCFKIINSYRKMTGESSQISLDIFVNAKKRMSIKTLSAKFLC